MELTQAQLDDYILRLEEAEGKIRAAEATIAEKDQRIMEVERLLGCMGKVKPVLLPLLLLALLVLLLWLLLLQEKTELQVKLQECEQRLRLLELTDTTDASVAKT